MSKLARESLLWSGMYVLILLSLITPLNFITLHFMIIPVVVLYVKLNKKRFIIHYSVALLLTCLISGSFWLYLTLTALLFLIPGVVIGELYKKKIAARTVLTAGVVTLLAQFLLVLVGITISGVNITTAITQFFHENMNEVPEMWKIGLTKEMVDQSIEMMTQMIPLALIGTSIYYIVITHWIGRRILNKSGEHIPGLRPVREWMLPKSFVWYYLIALILNLFVDTRSESVLSMILWNLIPLLMFAFSIQAISFLFFVAHLKKWNYALPIVGIVMFPFLSNILSLMGLFDVAFDIRGRLKKH